MREIVFTGATPILTVDNVGASLEHYEKVLGFAVSWQWSDDQEFEGGRPTFACVCRGDVSLFLAEQCQGNPGSWISLFLASLEDVDAMHEEFVASGAKIVEPPTDCPWGMREMLVEDLDGNTFRIGCQLPGD